MDSTFDLQRIFIGDESLRFLLEVVFRTAFMYVFLLFAVRFIGKRGMSQLTPFEYIIVILLGSAAGDSMFYPNVPLVHCMGVILTVVILEKIFSHLTNSSKQMEKVIESKAALLILDGKILDEACDREDISLDEMYMELRMHGVRNVGEVERAYLEPSGKLSVFKYSANRQKKGVSTFPQD